MVCEIILVASKSPSKLLVVIDRKNDIEITIWQEKNVGPKERLTVTFENTSPNEFTMTRTGEFVFLCLYICFPSTFDYCVCMLFSRKQISTLLSPIILNDTILKSVYSHKHLGLILTKKMTWFEHIGLLSIPNKAKKRILLLSAFKYSMSTYALFRCYLSFVRPLLEYADIILDNCFKQEKLMIENLQYAALRLVTGPKKGTRIVNKRLWFMHNTKYKNIS